MCEREEARSCPQGARVQERKLSMGCLVVPERVGGSIEESQEALRVGPVLKARPLKMALPVACRGPPGKGRWHEQHPMLTGWLLTPLQASP